MDVAIKKSLLKEKCLHLVAVATDSKGILENISLSFVLKAVWP